MPINILKLKDVIARTKLSRSTIYNKINSGDFPQQIRLGERSVGFIESEVEGWIELKIAESRNDRSVSL